MIALVGPVLAIAVLAIAMALVRLASNVQRPSVYRVSQLANPLTGVDRRWRGHMLLVQGVAWPCADLALRPPTPCLDRQPQPVLADPLTGTMIPLRVEQDSGDALLRFPQVLGYLPPVRALRPLDLLRWGTLATYRLWVEQGPRGRCLAPLCYRVAMHTADLGYP